MKNGRPIRACLLGASLSTGNMGVSALAAGTVSSLRNAYPEAEVFLLEYGKEPARYTVHSQDGPVGVELVNIRFSKKFFLPNNIARLLCEAFLIGLLPASRWKDSLYRKTIIFGRFWKRTWLRQSRAGTVSATFTGCRGFCTWRCRRFSSCGWEGRWFCCRRRLGRSRGFGRGQLPGTS
jgi:hypothetical protein